jgi:hypothetical protein
MCSVKDLVISMMTVTEMEKVMMTDSPKMMGMYLDSLKVTLTTTQHSEMGLSMMMGKERVIDCYLD